MKNYEYIEEEHMREAHHGALIFWISFAVCIGLLI